MKKIFWILISIFYIPILVTGAAGPFEDESWIGAYVFKKNLSAVEQYHPFVDIRERNFLLYQPGPAIRTILANFFLNKSFTILKTIDFDSISNQVAMTNAIKNEFSKVSSLTDYQKKMLELKAILVLKAEFKEKHNYLHNYLGNDGYNNFYYDFYHFQVIKKETSVPRNELLKKSDYIPKSKKSAETLNNIQAEYFEGAYVTKIDVSNWAIDDSRRAAERLNAIIPIKPNQINAPNSPLVTVEQVPMDINYKTTILQRFKDKIRFDWVSRINLLTFKFDKTYLKNIEVYFNLYDDSIIQIIHDLNKDKFGNFDTSGYNKNNLTALLKNELKVSK